MPHFQKIGHFQKSHLFQKMPYSQKRYPHFKICTISKKCPVFKKMPNFQKNALFPLGLTLSGPDVPAWPPEWRKGPRSVLQPEVRARRAPRLLVVQYYWRMWILLGEFNKWNFFLPAPVLAWARVLLPGESIINRSYSYSYSLPGCMMVQFSCFYLLHCLSYSCFICVAAACLFDCFLLFVQGKGGIEYHSQVHSWYLYIVLTIPKTGTNSWILRV